MRSDGKEMIGGTHGEPWDGAPEIMLADWQGVVSDVVQTSSSDVDLDEVAFTLARMPRFGGRIGRDFEHYSVAEHCCHVCDVLWHEGSDLAVLGLLHDAGEYRVTDIPTPIKQHFKGDLHRVERRVRDAVLSKIGFWPQPKFQLAAWEYWVKDVDQRMLVTEATAFYGELDSKDWPAVREGHRKYEGVELQYWDFENAAAEFLDRLRKYEFRTGRDFL